MEKSTEILLVMASEHNLDWSKNKKNVEIIIEGKNPVDFSFIFG